VLEESTCGTCGSSTRAVRITPPGDARPAFPADIDRIRSVVDRQFGHGCGRVLLPDGKLVVLNKAPDLDRTDEVIIDGHVIGALRFSLSRGETFLLRPYSAMILAPVIERGWVRVDSGAVDAITMKKASALAVGITGKAPNIRQGDEIIVLDEAERPVSVGISKMSSSEMSRDGVRGTAVKTRWVVGETTPCPNPKHASWKDAVEANREMLERRTEEARRFIRRTVQTNDLPVAVSFSGGKDSLATLMLVIESGIKPRLLFVDTGLEFEETKKNVLEVAKEHSLEILEEKAGDAFWENLSHFGPPAKDYRWCCKTCKLGPATRLIEKNFRGGVLSFIGQRAYESEQRSRKGRTWRNPWVPGQLGASPIQKWTALHVWLYLFWRNAKYNLLYERGLERIGCMMCPATDLAELRTVRDVCPEYDRWQIWLERYSKDHDMPSGFLEYDLWRWKRIPDSVREELAAANIDVSFPRREVSEGILDFKTTRGYSPCVEGLSMEGVFSRSLDMARVANLMNALGVVTTSPDMDIAEACGITVFGEGPVMIRGETEEELQKKASNIRQVVLRAMECVGCGICAARCDIGALSADGRLRIDADKCTHCGECLGPCPVVAFKDDDLDI